MEQILLNINDPSWWFTGIFFGLFPILLLKVAFSWLPKINKNYKRHKRKDELIAIKNHRQHDIKVKWLISRYWALVTVTLGILGLSFITFFLTPSVSKGFTYLLIQCFFFSLGYMLLFYVEREKKILLETIKENIKLKMKHNYAFNLKNKKG